jgi:type II secretory pathway pseudopilin PulG
MYTNHNKNERGFTIIESIVALGVGVTISLILATVAITGLANIRTTYANERIHAETIFVTDSLMYWIKQSTALSTPNPETLEITLMDATVKTVSLSDDTLYIDAYPITSNLVSITAVQFKALPKSVRINFVATYAKGTETFSAQTTIAQRN